MSYLNKSTIFHLEIINLKCVVKVKCSKCKCHNPIKSTRQCMHTHTRQIVSQCKSLESTIYWKGSKCSKFKYKITLNVIHFFWFKTFPSTTNEADFFLLWGKCVTTDQSDLLHWQFCLPLKSIYTLIVLCLHWHCSLISLSS